VVIDSGSASCDTLLERGSFKNTMEKWSLLGVDFGDSFGTSRLLAPSDEDACPWSMASFDEGEFGGGAGGRRNSFECTFRA